MGKGRRKNDCQSDSSAGHVYLAAPYLVDTPQRFFLTHQPDFVGYSAPGRTAQPPGAGAGSTVQETDETLFVAHDFGCPSGVDLALGLVLYDV